MTIRGKAAIVGIGETPHRRVWPGRSTWGLCAEAAAEAIRDAGLRREDIDGLMTFGGNQYPANMGEYIGVHPKSFAVASGFWGGSSGCALTIAANVVANGMAKYVLFVGGGSRDPANPGSSIFMGDGGAGPPDMGSEWVNPYGPVIAANTTYGFLYTRHMYEYGTKQEQLARMAVNQRVNTQENPLSAFRGQPISVEDVLNSRYVNYPLHLLECVMPVAGAIAYIVSTAELARTLKQPPVYVLGAGLASGYANSWLKMDMLETPVKYSAQGAYAMAGCSPKDIQFAEFYD